MKRSILSFACILHAWLFSYMTRTGLVLCDVDPKEIEAALKKIGAEVKEFSEKALAEAKKSGDLWAETKEKVDKMLLEQGTLQARLLEIEQKQDRARAEGDDRPKSAGEIVVESESFKQFMSQGGMRMPNSSCVIPLPRAAITSTATTNTTTVGVAPDVRPGVIPGTERRLTIRDLIMPGQTNSNAIQYVRESGFTNSAATVSETNVKPQSELTYELVQQAVVTIAHYFKASKQILDDFPQLQSMIDARGRYGLKLVEENQLLKGSGVGNNLNGIYTQATSYVAPITVAGPTRIDVLRLMILQAALAEYPASGIVLHPSDWAAIELAKDADGRYIFANPQSMVQPRMWGLPVVPTQAMTQDTALVGAFNTQAQVFDREEANVVIATQNEDDFIKNMITIRIEERLALAVYRATAFIKNTNLPDS